MGERSWAAALATHYVALPQDPSQAYFVGSLILEEPPLAIPTAGGGKLCGATDIAHGCPTSHCSKTIVRLDYYRPPEGSIEYSTDECRIKRSTVKDQLRAERRNI